MVKSISVKAETVEEAVQLALSILELKMEEVQVEVVTNPKRNLFGLRKMMAEVTVTQLKEEMMEDAVEQYIKMAPPTSDGVKHGLNIAVEEKAFGIRLADGKIEAVFSGGNYPIVSPRENVKLTVNGEQVRERTMILPSDEVKVTVHDELIPPQFSIQLMEKDMLAMLTFIPGKRVTRTLSDTEFKKVLQIEAEEEIEYYNDIEPQLIVERLKSMGIGKGLIFPAIKKVTEVDKPYEIIVAKGVSPIEGLDGDLEMHIDYKEKVPGELEKVDFRELNLIVSVEAGQVIATYIPSVPGTDGSNLLGKAIAARKVEDIVVRAGKNVAQMGNDIVAEISGRPSVDWRKNWCRLMLILNFFIKVKSIWRAVIFALKEMYELVVAFKRLCLLGQQGRFTSKGLSPKRLFML